MEEANLEKVYNDKLLRNPKYLIIVASIFNLIFQVMSMFAPRSDWHLTLNYIYSAGSVLALACVIPSFYDSKYNKYVRFGFMYTSIR